VGERVTCSGRPLAALGLEEFYEHCTVLSAAIDLYQVMEMTFWISETEAALAQMEGR